MFPDLIDLLFLPGAIILDRLLVFKEILSSNLCEAMMTVVLSSILSESTKNVNAKI